MEGYKFHLRSLNQLYKFIRVNSLLIYSDNYVIKPDEIKRNWLQSFIKLKNGNGDEVAVVFARGDGKNGFLPFLIIKNQEELNVRDLQFNG